MREDRVSDQGTAAVNEDSAGSCQSFFWVLDGATPIKAFSPDGVLGSQAEWLVKTTQEFLMQVLSSEKTIKEKDLFERLVKHLNGFSPVDREPRRGTEEPSMTFAMVRVRKSKLVLSVIGDCSIYVLSRRKKVTVFTDRRIGRYSDKTLAVFLTNRDSPEGKRLMDEQRRENQKKLNRWGGYWVANRSRKWIAQVRTKTLRREEVEAILLCSDGFERVFHPFGVCEPIAILDGTMRLGDALKQLRVLESEDGNRTRYPRLKVSDDATGLLLREIATPPLV